MIFVLRKGLRLCSRYFTGVCEQNNKSYWIISTVRFNTLINSIKNLYTNSFKLMWYGLSMQIFKPLKKGPWDISGASDSEVNVFGCLT